MSPDCILLPRNLLDWPLWRAMSGDQSRVLITLLLMAQAEDGRRYSATTRTFVPVPVGSFFSSQSQISIMAGVGRQAVRSAISLLTSDCGEGPFLSTQPTSHGTLYTICNYSIFQGRSTASQPAPNQRLTSAQPTLFDCGDEVSDDPLADALRLAEMLRSAILQWKPDHRIGKPGQWQPARRQAWAQDIDRLMRLDGATVERIEAVLRWLPTDEFWPQNIQGAKNLRKHFERIEALAGQPRREAITPVQEIETLTGEQMAEQCHQLGIPIF